MTADMAAPQNQPRKICVVTGTRAEYGLLRWLMQAIADDPAMQLQVVATGMHLSPEFGQTWTAIAEDGFTIDRKVEMLLSSDTPVGITKSMGLAMIGFADAFDQLAPDIVVLLGDRFEILAAASAAMIARIPIAHLHGGELTMGAMDDAIRHAVTKMSHFHFVANDIYRQRVLQLGEDPAKVHTVGGLGLDNIVHLPLLDRAGLSAALGFDLRPRNLLITFHPVTLQANSAEAEFAELLAALDGLTDTGLIFTLPNADTESRGLIAMVQDFVAARPHARAYTSLGQLRYLSALKWVDGVVGNSSSGLAEAPAFHIGTVNIGARQDGRLRAASVIDCAPERRSIAQAIARLYAADFQAILPKVQNPYGSPGASAKIAAHLRSAPLVGVLKKQFHDWDILSLAQKG